MKQDRDPSSAAGFSLRFEPRAGYLLAEVNGSRSSGEITLAYWREIAAECERIGAQRLLVADHFRGNVVTREEMLRCVHALRGSALAKLRIALYEPEAENVSALQHAELEALDVGIDFRVFGNEREAEVWLLYGY
jgi:hypothetical protein